MTQPAALPPAPAAVEAPQPWTLARVMAEIASQGADIGLTDIDGLPRVDGKIWRPQVDAAKAALQLQMLPEEAPIEGELPEAAAKRAEARADKVREIIASTGPVAFVRTYPCPIGPDHRIIWMFEGDAETAVYTLELSKTENIMDAIVTESGTARPRRYRIVHGQPEFTLASMPLDTWIDEVVDELNALVPE